MKVTVEDGARISTSDSGNSPVEVCFNALRGLGLTDESILKNMYAFSSQFVKEEKPKK
jgi:hypothetical protein